MGYDLVYARYNKVKKLIRSKKFGKWACKMINSLNFSITLQPFILLAKWLLWKPKRVIRYKILTWLKFYDILKLRNLNQKWSKWNILCLWNWKAQYKESHRSIFHQWNIIYYSHFNRYQNVLKLIKHHIANEV